MEFLLPLTWTTLFDILIFTTVFDIGGLNRQGSVQFYWVDTSIDSNQQYHTVLVTTVFDIGSLNRQGLVHIFFTDIVKFGNGHLAKQKANRKSYPRTKFGYGRLAKRKANRNSILALSFEMSARMIDFYWSSTRSSAHSEFSLPIPTKVSYRFQQKQYHEQRIQQMILNVGI